ncbi:MAG: AAA family ATPase [Fervidobacterium pennivorans]|uniref:AAA family ATPase n=2 Tax=Fervidobacterium TaxID=2422 RepID=A0AAI8GCW8_FERIS|nr:MULTISPECIES: AAA family ATPase [Fervidobacterium]AMW32394.1 AAA family ATPase [Fervidobacterium islandicum]QAV34025.1 hypothetical protein CBS1_10185 [Fervidobacterium changbaicum]SDH37633.1 DNA sulfur modification protein DndD [Fervidobacterium changbaicum]
MRLESVEITNYRQYVEGRFLFTKNDSQIGDLHVIVGKMGSGKTTFLEAVNWGLFGEELFSSRRPYPPDTTSEIPSSIGKYQQSSASILSKVRLVSDGEYRTTVKLLFRDSYETFRVIRSYKYSVSDGRVSPSLDGLTLSVHVNDSISIADKELEIEKRFPKALREHFFFDGESLDVYLKEVRGMHIKPTVEKFSKIADIEAFLNFLGNVRTKLIYKDLRDKEKNNRLIEQLSKQIEETERTLKSLRERLEQAKQQEAQINDDLREIYQKLEALRNYEKYKSEFEDLVKEETKKRDELSELLRVKAQLLLDLGCYVFGWNAIDEAYNMRSTSTISIPIMLPKSEIEKMLSEKTCAICGSRLHEHVLEQLKALLNSDHVVITEDYHRVLKKNIRNNMLQVRRTNDRIGTLEKEIADIQKRIEELGKLLPEDISNKIEYYHKERERLESFKSDIQRKIFDLENNIKETVSSLNKYKEELDKNLTENERLDSIKKQLDFVQKVEDIIQKSVERVRKRICTEITKHMREFINRVMWKKELIENISLSENFDLTVTDKFGQVQIKELSGGERSILTLALALAIHQVAGVELPIFIDRPLTNISGEAYYELIHLLSKLSEERQIIITMTDQEYNSLEKELMNYSSTIHYLEPQNRGSYYVTNVIKIK